MQPVTIPCGMAPNRITVDEEMIRTLQLKVCKGELLDGQHKEYMDAILSSICTGTIGSALGSVFWGVRKRGSVDLPTLFRSEREAIQCVADRGERWEYGKISFTPKT